MATHIDKRRDEERERERENKGRNNKTLRVVWHFERKSQIDERGRRFALLRGNE